MRSGLNEQDYRDVAERLVRRHGDSAILWAELAIDDLQAKGETWRAEAWRAVRDIVAEITGCEFTPQAPRRLIQ